MHRLPIALIAGIAGLWVGMSIQPSTGADREHGLRLLAGEVHECIKGTVEQRLDCLTYEILQLKRRVEMGEGRIMRLGTP